jgi:hypothetical protein
MKKARFTEEQMVATLREVDMTPVAEVAKKRWSVERSARLAFEAAGAGVSSQRTQLRWDLANPWQALGED